MLLLFRNPHACLVFARELCRSSSSILLAVPLVQYYWPDGSSRRGFLSRVLFLIVHSSDLLCEPTRTRWANCAAASNHAPARPQRSRATGSAAVAAMSDEDSSDDGSYAESPDGESESDDEIIEEPAVPEHPRSAAELIAALDDAPDEEIRAMMREAWPLRTDGDLPRDLLRAFGGRVPRLCIPSPPGVKGGIRQDVNSWALSAALASSQVLDFSLNFLLVLDEHLILVSVHVGVATLFGYDRYVVDDVFKRHGRLTLGTADRVELNTDIVSIVEEQLFTSSQDVHLDEKALSYARYFEPDENGLWQVPWLPLADGSFHYDRSEEVCSRSPATLFKDPDEQEQQLRHLENVFSGDSVVLYRLRALEKLYTWPVQTSLMPDLSRFTMPPTPTRRLAPSAAAATGPATSKSSSCGRSRPAAARRRRLRWRAFSATGSAPLRSSGTSSGACECDQLTAAADLGRRVKVTITHVSRGTTRRSPPSAPRPLWDYSASRRAPGSRSRRSPPFWPRAPP